MMQYRLRCFIRDATKELKRAGDSAPIRNSIVDVCRNCFSDRLLIDVWSFGKRHHYLWVERETREVIAEFTDLDAAEMAGRMLAK